MNSLSGIEHKGLVHLYTGDGKGKTTAAAGLAVRALSAGKTVLFCQLLKGFESGELAGLQMLGAKILRAKACGKFVSQMDNDEIELLKKKHEECFDEASRLILSGGIDVAVLDEAVDAVNLGIIREDRLLELIVSRPAHVEMIITGHKPQESLKRASDYETDFVCVKHPFDKGAPARRGIEF